MLFFLCITFHLRSMLFFFFFFFVLLFLKETHVFIYFGIPIK